MNAIEEYLLRTRHRDTFLRRAITCKDGATVSIQASAGHYCAPREDGLASYYKVEAGYPSAVPPKSWWKYAEDTTKEDKRRIMRFLLAMCSNSFKYKMSLRQKITRALNLVGSIFKSPLQMTVYPYMPISVAQEYIAEHGGIDWEKVGAPEK